MTPAEDKQTSAPINAFSDVRIYKNGSESKGRLFKAHQDLKNFSSLNRDSILKDNLNEDSEADQHLELLKELDFDKVVKPALTDRQAEDGKEQARPRPNDEEVKE